jgi:HAD superfamily hydrolase (TIGR01509 family)
MKSYLLWDHDGVLVETEPWYFEATRQCIRELGVELDHARYLKDMAGGHSAWHQASELGASREQIESCKNRRNQLYQRFLLEKDIEIAGVEAVLAQLAVNYAMAIVTTAKRSDFELIHAQRNIVEHMEFVLTNGDYPRAKPAPDPYLAALTRFSATPEQALVIEDSERGLRAAIAAGIDCVVVANEFVTGQNFSEATHFIDSLADLPELLDRL